MIVAIIIISLAFIWLGYETNWLRIRFTIDSTQPQSYLTVTLGYTYPIEWAAELEGEREAHETVTNLANMFSDCPEVFYRSLESSKRNIENELGLRFMPYHGGCKSLYPGEDTQTLTNKWKVFCNALGEQS